MKYNNTTMIYKSITFFILFLVIIVITYTFHSTTYDVKSQFNFFSSTTQNFTACGVTRPRRPLKVYMYDLPRRFNVGMISHRTDNDNSPVTVKDFPRWPRNSGLRMQHSVEYWMMGSLLYEGGEEEEEEREVVRVRDPEAAEVFFLPFFSSLSFNSHGKTMTDPETEVDKQLQVDILDFLRKSNYWQRSSGRDHVIPMHHPNAFRFLRDDVNASILIVADFGRYSRIVSNLSKDVVAPYVHVVDSFVDDDVPNPFESRPTLLFFKGRTVRKSEGKVRAKLDKILSGYDDVHYEQSYATTDSIKSSSEGMRSSKFCLHPAGDTPSSCRLFDAIVSHCVPVIVSDRLELPYEDELDYTQFSVFFSVQESLTPGYMVEQLRQFPKEKWLEMWRRLKEVSHHFEFQYPPKKEDAVNMIWRQVKHKVPAAKLAVHRSRRLKIPDWW